MVVSESELEENLGFINLHWNVLNTAINLQVSKGEFVYKIENKLHSFRLFSEVSYVGQFHYGETHSDCFRLDQ